jgi:hypothetical protein
MWIVRILGKASSHISERSVNMDRMVEGNASRGNAVKTGQHTDAHDATGVPELGSWSSDRVET